MCGLALTGDLLALTLHPPPSPSCPHPRQVVCTDIIAAGKAVDDLTLGPGKFFGERALLKSAPRAANVFAASDTVTPCHCLPSAP